MPKFNLGDLVFVRKNSGDSEYDYTLGAIGSVTAMYLDQDDGSIQYGVNSTYFYNHDFELDFEEDELELHGILYTVSLPSNLTFGTHFQESKEPECKCPDLSNGHHNGCEYAAFKAKGRV